MRLDALDQFARSHHGLISLDAAREMGLGRSTWYRWQSIGLLESVHPGVARLPGTARTREQTILAAVLAAGPGALASHRSSTYLWGAERPTDDPVDVMLVDRNREAALDGVIVHRPRDLIDARPVWRKGVPTTPLLRALCDLPAVDPGGIDAFVGHVVTNGMATVNALYQATRVHSRQGRAGVPAFRAALESWLADGRPLDSELEREMRRVSKRFGLPRMSFHAIICGYEVDFWVIGTDVVLECDGWEEHDKRRQRFEDDRIRRAELTAGGYTVVNFTWRQITRTPQWVASMVKGAAARSSACPTGSSGRSGSRIRG